MVKASTLLVLLTILEQTVRKILRARPIFKLIDISINKHRLNKLVRLRLSPKTLWVCESLVDSFMEIGAAEQVI